MITDPIQLGTILSVWAHPDDEGWLMSGIMATAIRNGQKVACVTATRGELGVQDEARWPAAKLGQIRENEMKDALRILGVTNHQWLGYSDGSCNSVPRAEAVDRLVKIIREVQPDSILTFGPDGLTGHPDHQCVCSWTTEALSKSGVNAKLYYSILPTGWIEKYKQKIDAFDVFFAIDEPPCCDENKLDICCKLSPEIVETKMKALAAHRSQTEAIIDALGEILPDSHGTETFRLAEATKS